MPLEKSINKFSLNNTLTTEEKNENSRQIPDMTVSSFGGGQNKMIMVGKLDDTPADKNIVFFSQTGQSAAFKQNSSILMSEDEGND